MKDIVIIGGGVAGLAAGIHAQMNGMRATVYERHTSAGGNLTGWVRDGYRIDNCIHWLTGTNPATKTYEMWKYLGALGDVPIYQGETLYTYEKDGKTLSLSVSLDKLRDDMLFHSPEDRREILSFIGAVRDMQRIDGISGEPFYESGKPVRKIPSATALVKYYRMTTGELANRFVSPLLRGFISSLLGEDFGALALIVVFSTFCGMNGGIPKGSSFAMAERLTDRFLTVGGVLHTGCGVKKINIKNGLAKSVTLDDGRETEADCFIISSDPASVFGHMLDENYMPDALRRQYADSRLRRFSSCHCAFSCDSSELPFSGDYIFDIPDKYRKILRSDRLIVREFSHEKSFAPEGKNIIQTMLFCSEEDSLEYIRLSGDSDRYREKKSALAETTLEILSSHFPALSGKLNCLDVWTPATYKKFTGSETGSYMSFTVPSGVIPHMLSPRVKNVKNIFIASQWLQFPGGLPTAAKSGIRAVDAILRDNKREIAKKHLVGRLVRAR